jgi:hypothetical protein
VEPREKIRFKPPQDSCGRGFGQAAPIGATAMTNVLREQTIAALNKFKELLADTNDPRVRALLLTRIPEIEAIISNDQPLRKPARIHFRKSMRRI